MPRCSVCKHSRTRLHKCCICDARLCGCCSHNPIGQPKSVRFCCYPDGPRCGDEFRRRSRASNAIPADPTPGGARSIGNPDLEADDSDGPDSNLYPHFT